MSELKIETFKPFLGDEFKVKIDDIEHLTIKLIEVEDKSNKTFESFSLIFSGQRDIVLNQMIHKFNHDTIGNFEMFITPIQTFIENEIHYQSVFSRFKNK